jgi:hypothetical protein
MSKLTALKEFGKKLFGKNKKVPEKVKTDLSSYPTSKNIDDLIAKEGDPFVRGKLLSIKDKKKKGTVIGKDGNVIGTPTKERTAKTIMNRHPGSYQLKKDGGRMGYKDGSKCKMAKKGKGRAYGQNS